MGWLFYSIYYVSEVQIQKISPDVQKSEKNTMDISGESNGGVA